MTAATGTATADDAPDFASLLAARPALKMHAQDGLCFAGVPLNAIADACGTPSWVYAAPELRFRLASLRAALSGAGVAAHIHYAVKANDHLAILGLLHGEATGADVVSAGEFLKSRHAGFAPADIVFSGVGKTPDELRLACSQSVGQINVESAEELDAISAIATAMGITAPVALRMNPDVDAGTHAKITTGVAGNKFGIPRTDIPSLYARAAGLPGIDIRGLALHIGSQILHPAPYAAAYAVAADTVAALRAAGYAPQVLDLGGGLGIGYGDEPGLSLPAYAAMLRRTVGGLGLTLMIEPGRYLAGPAGLLLTSVIQQKVTDQKRFVVLDAAMTELIRPALYGSTHAILPVSPTAFQTATTTADVVGPVCESSDIFAEAAPMPPLAPGSRLAILDAGAYGAVMSSPYNARPRAAAALIDRGGFHVITARQAVDDLWAHEKSLAP